MTAGWRTMASSLAGSRHREHQRRCEDAIGYRVLGRTGSLAIVVADGAGSAARGRDGADTAVATLLAGLAAIDADLASGALAVAADDALHTRLQQLLHDGHHALVARAAELGCPVRDTSCTAAAVLVRADVALVAQIGDVGTTLVAPDGEMRLVIPPVRGEYANQTEFLSSWPPMNLDRATAVVHDPVAAVIVHSDGLNEVFYDDPFGQMRPARRLLERLLDGLRMAAPDADMDRELEGFLLGAPVQARSSDDLSVVIACRRPLSEPEPTPVSAADDHDAPAPDLPPAPPAVAAGPNLHVAPTGGARGILERFLRRRK